MKFYHIQDEYIDFLKQYDSKVADNKHESRPYVGIVIKIGNVEYYAPFTSPKPKHLKMKNAKDFRKIANGRYGAINFNNMIPVPKDVLMLIDITHETDVAYRRLLQNQYHAINSDYSNIKKTAERLRNLICTDNNKLSEYDIKIKNRCCNLPLLESVYVNYNK